MLARARHSKVALALAAIAMGILVAAVSAPRPPALAATLDQLNSQLSAQQNRQQSLSGSLGRLGASIAALDREISLVRGREDAVRAELSHDRTTLAGTQAALTRERRLLRVLRARLAGARMLLSRQLVSGYETDRPDLVTVVLGAHGFTDLLEKLDFLGRAEQQQKSLIDVTRGAKARADGAARTLAGLVITQRQITAAATLHARALAGMNRLLSAKQDALAQARSAQQAALAGSRARAGQLRSQIGRIQAQQAAARAAAAASAATPSSSSGSAGSSAGPALGPSGGWAIPYAIVLCESGGQNLPPNSAGASGYYQILPSTWKLYGGSGPAAYLSSKAEQDAVASRIWAGGSGASQWVCAGIVGIH